MVCIPSVFEAFTGGIECAGWRTCTILSKTLIVFIHADEAEQHFNRHKDWKILAADLAA